MKFAFGNRSRVLGVVLAILGGAPLAPVQVAAQDMRVVQGVWTSGVHDRQFIDQLRSGVVVGTLHFWTLLKGGPKTMTELQTRGKLPIVHEWAFKSPLLVDPDTLSPEQENEQEVAKLLGVGAIVDRGGLVSSVAEGRDFRWRTWSHKQNLWRGTWVVRVLYADGKPVPCETPPCRWTFFVR
ncbi:hypothetical protein GCM10028785_09670 [Hydrogenophaga soli]